MVQKILSVTVQEILKKKDMEPQTYKQQVALQCAYVCVHMCSHMCGHMGSCILDILQGTGIAGAGTVSQVSLECQIILYFVIMAC